MSQKNKQCTHEKKSGKGFQETKINYVWWKITNKSSKERCGNKIGEKNYKKLLHMPKNHNKMLKVKEHF